jgi:hypothetical protein
MFNNIKSYEFVGQGSCTSIKHTAREYVCGWGVWSVLTQVRLGSKGQTAQIA